MALNRKLSEKPLVSDYSAEARIHIYEPNDFSQSPTGSDYQLPISNLEVAATDTNAVHKTGNETAQGIKTWQDMGIFEGDIKLKTGADFSRLSYSFGGGLEFYENINLIFGIGGDGEFYYNYNDYAGRFNFTDLTDSRVFTLPDITDTLATVSQTIPINGTTAGNPINGEFETPFFITKVLDNGVLQTGNVETGTYLEVQRNDTDIATFDKLVVKSANGISSQGLVGDSDYSANLTDLAYPQVIWVNNQLSNKADLVSGVVPSSQLPATVDEILEYADFATFPVTGESNKYYLALDTNKTYRWSGSVYTPINEGIALGETSSTAYRGDRGKTAYDHSQSTGNPHGATTSDISDSLNKRYVTDSEKTNITHSNRTILDNITEAFTTALKTAYDTASSWITTNGTNVLNHVSSTSNPHGVTKSQVGLSNVDNTSDANKPVSTAQATAIGLKEDSANKSTSTSDSASSVKFPVWSAIVSYFSASQIRSILGISTLSGSNTGDQDLSGLMVKANNLSDLTNASTARTNLGLGTLATQSGTFTDKQDNLVSGTNIKTINGSSILGSGNLTVSGGATNLTTSQTSTTVTINSDTGTDATISLANGTIAGVSTNDYTTAEQTKLSGIATGATANSSDATLLNRANHTGTQLASTISDFTNSVLSLALSKTKAVYTWTLTTATAGVWEGTAGAGAGTYTTALPTDTNLYTSCKRARYANVVTTLNQVLGQRNTEAIFFRGSAVSGAGGFTMFGRGGFDVWTNGGRFFFGMASATTVISANPSALNDTVGFCVDDTDNGLISFLTRGTSATKVSTGLTITSNKGYDMRITCNAGGTSYDWYIKDINTGTIATGTATLTLPTNNTKLTANMLASNGALTTVTAIQLGVCKMTIETDY